MRFELGFTEEAEENLKELKENPSLQKQYKAVVKALRFLEQNPRHPSLQTHPYYSFSSPKGEKIFEAYAEQHTPGAYRIFFYYDSSVRNRIVIFAITPHP